MYYNTEYKLTYFEKDSDTLYRKELLDVFNLKNIDSFDELEKILTLNTIKHSTYLYESDIK